MNAEFPTTLAPRPGQGPGYSAVEEIANAVTHGTGTLFALGALVAMVIAASIHGDARSITAVSIYGASLVILYLTSTLYHASPPGPTKAFLRRCDHAAIFLLIGGTYTPLLLLSVRGALGWSVAGTIWGLMLVGIGLKLLCFPRYPRTLLVLYLAMGWAAVAIGHVLWQKLSPAALAWLLAGGITYTLGIAFYARKEVRFTHAIWHLFVLGGSGCHFALIYRYVIPR